jgi:hypothetical protein
MTPGERKLWLVMIAVFVLILALWSLEATDPTGDGSIDSGRMTPTTEGE